ncbi:xanthine dehydrogenase family protein molybdopterin-binding subunit [Tunturibacter empetritectus]|uniref:CO/xanthine dehydrogenase Mo-binding subunit n=1 Tax=Tunturiibacter empetritectus TaxID=3069691 RepID=A0A7W8IMK9_9BACT|nr:xanthine dehydrogenase family protein molybdopterin-binding subunit [Edaphobacter lichenicola]MBB5319116.1 CO/xanthine dehydrogenase Mo-binding subunit [Edaphobacter lichenicola]
MTSQPQIVGSSPIRKEGRDKVLGRAQYVDDITLPGMWFGATVRSTIPRGRITSIAFDPTIPWNEYTIVSAADIPGENCIVHLTKDHPCLAVTHVNHAEEPILLLAHPNRSVLPAAVAAVHITYEELPAIYSIEDSEKKDQIIWGEGEQANTFKTYLMQKDQKPIPDEIWQTADYIVEGEYRTGAQEQLYIENNGVIAEYDTEKGVTVRGSMQCPYYLVHALELVFNLPAEKCRVIQTETGGAFGGKEDFPSVIGSHAALLAMKSGHPVKLCYDRAEDMAATTKRHPSRTRHRTAVSKDGKLLAGEIDFAIDGGAYATLSPVVLSRGTIHAPGPYHWPHLTVRAKAVATNIPPHGAFRGFGAPQSIFALERHMDKIAKVVGLTPEELRRRNFLGTGGHTATGQLLKDPVDMQHLLTRALEESNYHAKREQFDRENPTSTIKRGIGFASFFHGAGFTGSGERRLNSLVEIELTPEGQPRLLVSSTEFGQGTNTILCQIAAQTLHLPYDQILIAQPDTGQVPNSGPTVASRTAMVVGKLVERAAQSLLATLAPFSSSRSATGGSAVASEPPHDFSPEDFRPAALHYLAEHGSLKTEARYQSPGDIFWDDETYSGEAYPAYAWAVYVAEVAVDTTTYSASVTNFYALQEVGKVLHPILAAGQIEGGVAQGVGYALYEKCIWNNGRLANNQMTNYIMPTSADVPPIHVTFEEIPSPHGAFGAKGIGELPMDGPAPAILNAIEHATGIAFTEIPLLPEDIFERMTSAPGAGSESLDPAIAGPVFSEATA